MNRRHFFNKAAMFVAGCALALKCNIAVKLLDDLDLDEFQRLPFYLVKNEVHRVPYKNWEVLMSKCKWQSTMGSVTRAVV